MSVPFLNLLSQAGAMDTATVTLDDNVLRQAVLSLRRRFNLVFFGFDGERLDLRLI